MSGMIGMMGMMRVNLGGEKMKNKRDQVRFSAPRPSSSVSPTQRRRSSSLAGIAAVSHYSHPGHSLLAETMGNLLIG